MESITFIFFNKNNKFIFFSIGSGKTSLFHAIITEMKQDSTSAVSVFGSISYVPQKYWILNDTLRNNILFNNVYDEERYNLVVEACCLKQDFSILENNDQTMIGT